MTEFSFTFTSKNLGSNLKVFRCITLAYLKSLCGIKLDAFTILSGSFQDKLPYDTFSPTFGHDMHAELPLRAAPTSITISLFGLVSLFEPMVWLGGAKVYFKFGFMCLEAC